MRKAIANITMDNEKQHTIIEESTVDAHAKYNLIKRLENARSFLVTDDEEVLLVSQIHSVKITEE